MRLTSKVHDRDVAGLTYVYPVVSRRAGGVSVGINLSPNNACNWRCVYCQVPNLQRGALGHATRLSRNVRPSPPPSPGCYAITRKSPTRRSAG